MANEPAVAGITAILFDLDGVLVDSMPFHYESYRQVLEPEGLAVARDDIYLREGLGTPEVLRELSARNGWNLDQRQLEELVARRRARFWEIYQHRVFPEIPPLLDALAAQGYALAVVSGSTRKTLTMCLEEQRLADGRALGQWFRAVISGSEVERGKPHPEPYLKAMAELGAQPAQTLVIENAPIGIRAAKAAGARCVAVASTLAEQHLQEADWIVKDHPALSRWLTGSD